MVKAVKILTWPITKVITEEDQDQDKYRQHKSINLQTGTSGSKSLFYFWDIFIFAAAGWSMHEEGGMLWNLWRNLFLHFC